MEYTEILKALRNYFATKHLENLDNGKPFASAVTNPYSAVSLNYIYTYVLKEQADKKDIAKALRDLSIESLIMPKTCGYANGGDLVWRNKSDMEREGRKDVVELAFVDGKINKEDYARPRQKYGLNGYIPDSPKHSFGDQIDAYNALLEE